MSDNIFANEIKLVAAVCVQDEVISSAELDSTFNELNKFGKIESDDFDFIIDEFFEEEETLEEYFFNCQNSQIPLKDLIRICKIAATSDGFELRENLAFIKLCRLANLDPKNYFNDEI
tara:strand:+ start:823 stop:1176 length:354 start_codon:yes stop_codon:yes gene_type:complete